MKFNLNINSMTKDYNILEYNNYKGDIRVGDVVKITIFFDQCINKEDNKVLENAKEHIWCLVTEILDESINVSINNHMLFMPIDNYDSLDKDKILTIRKVNIREHKRYTEEGLITTTNLLIDILKNMRLEHLTYLENCNKEEAEVFLEQYINTIKYNF